MRVLLIAEGSIAATVSDYLFKCRHRHETTSYGHVGLHLVTERPEDYDCIIMQHTLSDISGADVVRALRESENRMPVILIVAGQHTQSDMAGIDAQAFVIVNRRWARYFERINEVAKQLSHPTPRRIGFGDIQVDLDLRVARARDTLLLLQPKVYGVLEELVRSKGNLVGWETLMTCLYGTEYRPSTGIHTLSQFIHMLRKRLKEAESSVQVGCEWPNHRYFLSDASSAPER